MRRLAPLGLAVCTVLLGVACGKYLPNAPEELPVGGPPVEDRGLTVTLTSDKEKAESEGVVTFTATTAGGGGQYRYSWSVRDCYEEASGRERCEWHNAMFVEAGNIVTFTRYRRAIDTRVAVTVQVRETGTAKYGEATHSVLGPNDRTD